MGHKAARKIFDDEHCHRRLQQGDRQECLSHIESKALRQKRSGGGLSPAAALDYFMSGMAVPQ